jgi:hypothetical protein
MIVIHSNDGNGMIFGVVVDPINNALRNRVDWNIVSSSPRTRRKCRGFDQPTGIPHNRLQQTVKRMSALLSASPLFALIRIVYQTSFDRIDSINVAAKRGNSHRPLKATSYCHVSRSDSSLRLIGEYGVRSVKDSTGLKQAFTVNEATMNHEDTINLSAC